MSNSSIWPIDRTLSGATTLSLSGPGSNGNKGVVHIPQSSCITRVSPSDYLVSCPGHSLGKSCPSAEMQSVCSTATADWANSLGKSCPSAEMQSVCSTATADWANSLEESCPSEEMQLVYSAASADWARVRRVLQQFFMNGTFVLLWIFLLWIYTSCLWQKDLLNAYITNIIRVY